MERHQRFSGASGFLLRVWMGLLERASGGEVAWSSESVARELDVPPVDVVIAIQELESRGIVARSVRARDRPDLPDA